MTNSGNPILGTVLTETDTPCYAWALIPNHAHLLLKTGRAPISTVMRRLLTGHAAYFNRRHRRHGKLFQSRYKSILCQEDAYLLELVRYIHLNPLRAKCVSSLKSLEKWSYSGHSSLLGNKEMLWQDADYILRFFGRTISIGRHKYREYVFKGENQGRRPELTGGGLIRSMGGWSSAKMLNSTTRMKSDERILGDGDFVIEVLEAKNERFESRYNLRKKGYDLNKLTERLVELTGVNEDLIWAKGKHPKTVMARSILCYWACRKLGMKTTELSKLLNLSQPSISQSVRRGEILCRENDYELIE
jgi:putative transposase